MGGRVGHVRVDRRNRPRFPLACPLSAENGPLVERHAARFGRHARTELAAPCGKWGSTPPPPPGSFCHFEKIANLILFDIS